MYTCNTDSVSHLRDWCSVKHNNFIIEIHTNKYMTSYCTLVCSTLILCERVKQDPPVQEVKLVQNQSKNFYLFMVMS